MNTYILRRLLLAIPTVIGVAIVVFVLMRMLPGDVADLMREDSRYWTPEFSEQIRASLGLNRPVHEQFGL
jgi:peptide/nickel transport system permease protein